MNENKEAVARKGKKGDFVTKNVFSVSLFARLKLYDSRYIK